MTPRSPRPSVGRPGSAFPCCAVGGRRGNRAGSPASDAAPPRRARTRQSWVFLRSDSRYQRCPTRPAEAGLPLAPENRASVQTLPGAPRRSVLVRSEHRIAQYGHAALVTRRDRIELDRLAARALEQADAVANQHRGNVDDDLVEESFLQALPGDVRAEDDNVPLAGRLLGDGHRLLDVDVQKAPGDALDDRRVGRRIVSKHEERSLEGAEVEPWLQAGPPNLRSATDQQRSRRRE